MAQNFNDATIIENACFDMRQNDWLRSQNRALINRLFNGFAPYTEEEVRDNGIEANYNDLTALRKAHDARGQMYQALLKPGNFFRATANIGPRSTRYKHSETVTRHMNRIMKRSMSYYEVQRGKIAQAVLHGIGTAMWPDCDAWCPKAVSIEDVFIPTGETSELPMDRLPLFAIHKSLTAPLLRKLTRGPNVDPGWQMDMVNACLKWIDSETANLNGNNWPDFWNPAKQEERIKEGDAFGISSAPTIEVYDFYFWYDDGKKSGWKRRMILDAWGTPESMGGGKVTMQRRKGDLYENKDNQGWFLYKPDDKRFYAANKSEIITFQFADLSAVAPFRYHTIRGLGFLLHDPCSVQNRLTCKITEATFETLTVLMRVKSQEDVQRALKADLFNRGFVDETVQFIPPNERWQVNTGLVEYGYNKNRELIDQSASTHSQNQDMSKGVEKGQLQIMAELNATTALLSAALLQYYRYQKWEYMEDFRRFLNPDPACRDVEVREFRANCLRDGVPVNMLNDHTGWDVEPEQVMGAGNKTLEMAIAQQLLAMLPLYDPDAKRKILRDVTLAITDDPALSDDLVPEEPRVSDTVHDTELVYSSLMAGHPITPKDGLNSEEAASTTLKMMSHTVQQIMQSGGVGTPQDIHGLTLAAGYAVHFIKLLEGDKQSANTGKELMAVLSKLGNQIKAMQQRQQEMAKKAHAQNGNGQLPPEKAADIQATILQAKTKAKLAQDSHAQKTAQRQIAFEQKMKQDQQKHQMELHKATLEHGLEVHKKDIETAANVKRGGMKSFESGGEE